MTVLQGCHGRYTELRDAGMVIPRLPRSDLTWATAIVGAIIMPHNIYLHSALVQSRWHMQHDQLLVPLTLRMFFQLESLVYTHSTEKRNDASDMILALNPYAETVSALCMIRNGLGGNGSIAFSSQ